MQQTDQKVTANLGSQVTLASIKEGKFDRLFTHAVSAVLKNIKDPKTPARKARRITLKMEFEPQSGRDYAIAKIAMTGNCFGDFKASERGFFISGSGSTAAMQEQPDDMDEEEECTSPDTAHSITLSNIIEGAVDEAFQVELQKVAANIRDPNTEQTAKRKLSVTFVFAPREQRNYAGVRAAIASSCSGHNSPLISSLVISVDQGVITAHERIVDQGSLF